MPPQKESSLAPAQPDFYVRRAIKNTPHLFQVYFTPTQAWFIRLGGTGAGEMVAAANGGLIGALFVWFLQSRRQKKEAQTIAEHSAKTLEQMLAGHKVNHVIPLTNFADPSLEGGNWAMKQGTVIWKFNLSNEQKRVECYFHKEDDITAAMNRLPRLFPAIRIDVAFDQRKGKYLKKPNAA